MAVDPQNSSHMKRKELTKTFIMISNGKKRFSYGLCKKYFNALTMSSLILHCHPLQAANCCRNSRLVVDEDDLMWVKT